MGATEVDLKIAFT